MSNGTRICKICGCEYPYCKTIIMNGFRYQDVACSPEHATEYFRKIELSRLPDEPIEDRTVSSIEDEDDVTSDEDYDEDFEEDFDDKEEIDLES